MPSRRVLAILVLAVSGTAVAFALPPFTLGPDYYAFADRRHALGIPNFMDVISNLPWLLIGLAGLRFIGRTRHGDFGSPFRDGWERGAFAVLFGGVVLLAFGSAAFHLDPRIATLLWDRLPMTIVFMSLFGIVIAERIDRRAGRLLFVPLLLLGVASVLYWRYTESMGRGDVRLYGLVQFFPMAALPLILWLFPRPAGRTGDLLAVIAWYAVAKLCEIGDVAIFTMTGGTVSGHTLKHLTGGVATIYLLRMMMFRRPAAVNPPAAGVPAH